MVGALLGVMETFQVTRWWLHISVNLINITESQQTNQPQCWKALRAEPTNTVKPWSASAVRPGNRLVIQSTRISKHISRTAGSAGVT